MAARRIPLQIVRNSRSSCWISRQGYAVVHEEFEIGLAAVAVPIFNHVGNVIAAVSISGPTFRFPPETGPGLTEGLREAGLAISAKMG